jgi:hypothetical protein
MTRKCGQVKEIHGGNALVKTLSVKTLSGSCCGGLSFRTFEEIEARNLCGAEKGDWVIVESEGDREKERTTLLTLGTFSAFLFGGGLAQAALKAAGWTTPEKIVPVILGIGLAAGAAALAVFIVFYRKHPLKTAAASRIVPAPEQFEEKTFLI